MTRQQWAAAALLTVAGLMAGCGSNDKTDPNLHNPEVQLKEIYDLYKSRLSDPEKPPPPTKIDDFVQDEPGAYIRFQALREGQCVFLFKAVPPRYPGSTVLAHQKDVPSQGGFVLLKDGTVKKMTVEEF